MAAKRKKPELRGRKLALIIAAGKLFAEHGLEAVRTRTIAEAAGTPLSAIHYYFKSKEDLYVEIFRYTLKKHCRRNVGGVAAELGVDPGDPRNAPKILSVYIRQELERMLENGKEDWEIRLIMQELICPSGMIAELISETFRPEHMALFDFYRKLKPGQPEMRAHAWATAVCSQVFFLIHAKEPLLRIMGRKDFDAEVIDGYADHILQAMLAGLA